MKKVLSLMTILLVFSCKKENTTPNQPTELTPEISKSITLSSKTDKNKKLKITITGNSKSVENRINTYKNIEFDFISDLELKNVKFTNPKQGENLDSNAVSIDLNFIGFESNEDGDGEMKQLLFFNKTEKAWVGIGSFTNVSSLTSSTAFSRARIINRTNRWYLGCLCRKYNAYWYFYNSTAASSPLIGTIYTTGNNQEIFGNLGKHPWETNNVFYSEAGAPNIPTRPAQNLMQKIQGYNPDTGTFPDAKADISIWYWL
jgi:hypothetical protein